MTPAATTADRVELVFTATADPLVRYGAAPRPADARLRLLLKEALRRHGFRLASMRNLPAGPEPPADEIVPQARAGKPRRPKGRLC